MKNISFDNPYLLLLIIPLLAAVIVPYCISIRRENRTRGAVAGLICHILIAIIATLAVSGMTYTAVMTKTQIYVLADVSGSTAESTDLMDGYIKELYGTYTKNTDIGVITFGADCKLHTKPGKKFTTVKNSGVNDSATDIISALSYAGSLFEEDTIKRIVLYTDGMSTDPQANAGLVRTMENLADDDVYIDIVYIDSGLTGDETEIQVSEVEFNKSTYLGHDTTANVLIESTKDTDAIVKLTKNGAAYLERTVSLSTGYNMINFELDTEEHGEFDYAVSVYTLADTSSKNNSFDFTQTVNEKMSVLLITDKREDVSIVKDIYGSNADIDAYVKPAAPGHNVWAPNAAPFNVPFTVEDLCKYDEYVLSNVMLDEINNADNFVKALDICVSIFGKSLITAGNNNLQNSDATCVQALNNMLPVGFGNTEQDPKLYTIVIDSSRSMEFKNFDYFKMAKSAGKYMLDLLNEGDYFALVHFSGEVYVEMTPTEVTEENVTRAKAIIDSLEVTQGTMIGRTLEQVDLMLRQYTIFSDKQVMLISDGMSFEGGEVYADDPIGAAARLKENGVVVSALNAGNDEGVVSMQNIAAAGGGKYYFSRSSEDLVGVMFGEVADDVTDSVVTGPTEVIINRENDDVIKGIVELPPVHGYLYAKAKASAENVLLVNYVKSGGTSVKAPLYAYWNYGNGRVSTLTTNLGGDWVADWSAGDGRAFLSNITTTNTPEEKNDYPYTVELDFDGKNIHIEIVPIVVNPDAVMNVKVTRPDGSELTEKLVFDSYRYFYKLETNAVGKYNIDISYDFATKSYGSTAVYSISYSPEYDRFAAFSPAVLYAAARDNATVTDGANAELKIDPLKLETYVIKFTVPFLALAAALYVADTVMRILRWADVVSFFKKRRAAR